jgi:glycosyltransferase involved in cell wall biosynthesis
LKKKKLLIFCPGYPSFHRPINGIFTQRSVLALSKIFDVEVIHLRALKFGRKLISVDNLDGITVIRVSVIQLPNLSCNLIMFLNAYLYSLILPKLLPKQYFKSFDYFHSTMLFPTSLIIAKLAKSLGKPHIAQGIGNDINRNLSGLIKYKWVKSRLLLVDCFQLNSNALDIKLGKEFPESVNRFVLHRGVDLDLFSLKKEQQMSKDGVRFLFLGGVQDKNNVLSDKNYKGIHVLLKAWSLIEQQISNSHLTIGGTGSSKEIFTDWLNKIAHPEKISFTDSVPPEVIPQLLKRNEVLIIPSLFEGLPNLANESQATGTVVVASKVGGIPETVVDGHSGFLFPVGDYEALAEILLKMVEISNDLYSFGLYGRRNMEEHFSWQNYVEKIDKKFIEIQ